MRKCEAQVMHPKLFIDVICLTLLIHLVGNVILGMSRVFLHLQELLKYVHLNYHFY
jgi:hypothetical protein